MFKKLPRVEEPKKYLEFSLSRSARRVSQLSTKGTIGIERIQRKECERLGLVRDYMVEYLRKIHDGWPSIDELPEFYLRLLEHTLSIDKLKQALGSLSHAQTTIRKLTSEYLRLIDAKKDPEDIKKQTKQFLGRVQSVMNKIAHHMTYLEHARNVIHMYPTLDTEGFIVAIAGFPNVGKSTLLKKVTGANPEIKNYAFTTKGLNSGSFEYKFSNIQLVDTPGTLGRTKENDVEYLATITRQYAARLVVYVFDATESYPMIQQEKLYSNIKEEGHDMLIYLSKTDLLTKEQIHDFQKKHPEAITSPVILKKHIREAFDSWQKN